MSIAMGFTMSVVIKRMVNRARMRAVTSVVVLSFILGACQNPAVTDQNILVRQDSTFLANGTGEYMFCACTPVDGFDGYVSEGVVFTIENQGQKGLNISDVSLSSGDTWDFELDTSALAGSIAALSTSSFTVYFDPLSGMGLKSAVVAITSDDADEPTYTFTVKAFGLQKLTAADGAAWNRLGSAVAVSGDTVVVGAEAADAAYVYYRNEGGADNWGQVKKLAGANGFGGAVALAGDTLVIGAESSDRAQIFYKNEGGTDNWGVVRTLSGYGDTFGCSVALCADTVVVGARRADVSSTYAQGSASIFYRDQGGADSWGHVKTITAGDGRLQDYFGSAVAVAGDTIMVGSTSRGSGSVYVFSRDDGGMDNWGQVKKIIPSDGATGDRFGSAIALEGEVAVVGMPCDDLGGAGWHGSAYILYRDQGGAGNWGEVKKLISSGWQEGYWFGDSVAISGNSVVVGAYYDRIDSKSGQGSAYLFSRNEGGTDNWGEVQRIIAADGEAEAYFGNSVGISADTVVIGADRDDVDSNEDQGSGYIWEL